jgi:hypothetical protein
MMNDLKESLWKQFGVDDLIPDRIYSKKELLDYLQSNRDKCHQVIAGLTEEK